MEGIDRSDMSEVGNEEVDFGQTNVHNFQQSDPRYRRNNQQRQNHRSNQQRQRRQSMNSSQRARISIRRRANYQTRLNSINIVQNQTEVNQENIGPTSAGNYDFLFFCLYSIRMLY
ncbi:hypothetical protein D8674_007413 [Pyrus ussuriensis x Pyrus communis]|uniref:Uncharacterized protein n=1 Tax=Pyrus ussuriensis x Pyrus communis TaxID=2448454 RepID=A0A5N5G512_9ROSA|nr:hypothetical protein D8674_018360 [Pyrus ussuriensis x Pyrus communis]KAB2629894.1 hypothetical protein D8674_007413 [Pyrus ussuriensis x Pyrus communis]